MHKGLFDSEHEWVRTAVVDFLRNRRLELTEEFQREEIVWALEQKLASR